MCVSRLSRNMASAKMPIMSFMPDNPVASRSAAIVVCQVAESRFSAARVAIGRKRWLNNYGQGALQQTGISGAATVDGPHSRQLPVQFRPKHQSKPAASDA